MKQLLPHLFSTVNTKIGIIAFVLFSTTRMDAQIIHVDSLPIKALMYKPAVETARFSVQNDSKDNALIYQSHIEYKRVQGNIIIGDSLSMAEAKNANYNAVLQYVDTAYLSSAYGDVDLFPLTVATRFTAGENGFNLSDIGTWFIPEKVISGTIQVEIRAGGNSISDAVVVSQGSAPYKITQDTINGRLFNIKLSEEVTLYPNEDFYVVFRYPAGITHPQGCAVNNTVETVPGRYWVEINNEFVDLQQLKGYSNGGWLMYAAEASSKNIGWLNLSTNASGFIGAENSISIRLELNGLLANLGSQYADVVILSNDTLNPQVRFPVELRLNEAPYFLNAPSIIIAKEGVSSEVHITVKDMENDSLSITPVMGCKFVQFSFNDSILSLYISPEKKYAGNYTIKFAATDKYGMSRELEITIYVLPNQPPVFLDPPAEITVEETKTLDVQIRAEDPEMDGFVINLSDNYSFITQLSVQPELNLHFSPQIGDAGDYVLHVMARDTTGSENELIIPLHVLIKNRPPVYVGENSPIIISFFGDTRSFDIADYFIDLDGDSFTFKISGQDSELVEVITDSKTYFSIKPKSVGMLKLNFTLTDERGAQSQYTIEVIVGQCENPEHIIVQKWNKTLLVNNRLGEYDPDGYQWYRDGIPIKNATRQDYSSEDDAEELLNFTAKYFVRMIKLNGDTVYSCPYTPVRTSVVKKIYPNPVATGESLHIENESTDSGSGIIQIVDILGRIRKTIRIDRNLSTIQAPDIPGLYLVKVMYRNEENIFRIKVY